MNSFLLSTNSQMEIQNLDNKIHETVDTINTMKTQREFYLSFSKDPQLFINKWLISQSRDLKMMTDVAGNPEEERRTDFYYQPWASEAVCRYFYSKIQQKRAELDSALGVKSAWNNSLKNHLKSLYCIIKHEMKKEIAIVLPFYFHFPVKKGQVTFIQWHQLVGREAIAGKK